jgi:hypothetical protein
MYYIYITIKTNDMTQDQKITSRRDLAIRLYNGSVNIELLSKKVEKTVKMWLSRNEVIIENGFLKLA